MNMLTVNNVEKSFGGIKAVQGSNFEIEEEKITALIGPNGAGKTTLFNIIGGYLKPDQGSVKLKGKELIGLKSSQIANMGVSRTFQQVRLFKYLSILDHLRMVEDNEDTKFWKNAFTSYNIDRDKHEQTLEKFGIECGLDTLVSELSYGQRKLLDIAMALQKDHELLMLDEPVAGVNKVIQEHIENLLLDLKKENETILLIDHDMEFIRKMSDHVIVLDAGKVLVEGPPESVLNDERVLEAYLGE